MVLLSGIGCYQCRVSAPTLQSFNDLGIVEIKGQVERDPEFEGGFSRLSLSAQAIKVDSHCQKVSGKILIYTEVFSAYGQGDLLKVTGELHSLSQIENPDYRAYLSQQGFCSIMSYPEIESRQRGWLFSLRNRLAQSLSSALPEPQGSLAQALLLGIRSHIPDSLRDDFRSSGTAHLIAISGLNLAILVGIVLSSVAWVLGRKRPTYIIIAFSIIWVYALLVGMQPPVMRSAIMFSLFLAALWLGRPASALPSLALAAAIMVGISPLVLWDISFQLSFLAVAGLAILMPPLQSLGRKAIPGKGGALVAIANPIIDSLAVTLAAVIATLPLIAYYFGYISVVALPANLFVLLALPGAIILTLLVALFGLLSPALSWVIGWVAWLFLSYIMKVVEGFGALPSYEFSPISGIIVWAYYGVLVAILSRKRLGMTISKLVVSAQSGLGKLAQLMRRLPKKWVLGFLLVAAILVWVAVLTSPSKQLEVSFLDVGQGDAILIQTPSGQQILVDGGPDPDKICLALGNKLPFWDKSLDLVVLTHADDDHLVGLVEVLSRYKVGQVLEPGFEHDTLAYREWLRLIDEKNIQRTIAKAGQQIELGEGIRLEVLHPQEEFLEDTDSDTDNNSVVLRLVWKEMSFLLTGDIHQEAEREILYRGYKLNSNILKVAHHGSSSSTSEQFLTAVDPEVAVICVGDNPFGHPHNEIVQRLLEKVGEDKVYLTSKEVNNGSIILPKRGTITFTTDGARLWVKTER